MLNSKLVGDLIKLSKEEDLSDKGDLSSIYAIPADAIASAQLISKAETPVIFSNQELAKLVVESFDDTLELNFSKQSGDSVERSEVILSLQGNYRSILTLERTLLNFLQRMSGIATLTREYVKKVRHTKAKILDTRKTTPGFRVLAKQAVVDGGGVNHRMGLYDAVMLKDNHLGFYKNDYQKKLQPVVDKIKAEESCPVIIEVDTIEQFKQISLIQGVDRILLDNMTTDQLKEAVELNGGKLPLEASGGVNLNTVKDIAETGVDYISVGALTHSSVAVDLSLEFAQ